MKAELKEKIERELAEKVKEKANAKNVLKYLSDNEKLPGIYFIENLLEDNKYKFGKDFSIEWRSDEEIGERKVKLNNVIWRTPMNIVRPTNRGSNNTPGKHVEGRIKEITVEWIYDPNGELEITIHDFEIEDNYSVNKGYFLI